MSETLDRLTTALADRYRIERELGAGGMATVYLADDLKLHRQVAIKVLRPELAAILGAERFLGEVDVTANLQHPNILPLHDSGEADSFLYYVMPYVEGVSLRDRLLREKQLGVEETIKIAEGVAAALDHAHQHGVIHRDIKPENILLRDGQAVVADFGIALAVSQAGGTRLTETGLSLGTPQYMSPEQATGDRELTAASDVYALGCVIYEMLAGEPPFTAPTVPAVVAKIMTATPAPIRPHRDTVPPNVEDAVLTALAKLPADRFTTGAALVEALRSPGYSRPVSTSHRAASGARTPRRRETLIRAFQATAIAGVAMLVMRVFLWPAAPEPGPVTRFDLTFPDGNGPLGALAISPDGRFIIYEGKDSTGTRRLFLRALHRAGVTPVPGSEEPELPLLVSPDGTRIGFNQRGRFRTMRLDGSGAVSLPRLGTERIASWGPGDTIVYADLGRLYRVAASGGDPVLLAAPQDTVTGRYNDPHVLPGGRTFIFTIGLAERRLAAMSLDDGVVRELEREGGSPKYVADGTVVFWSGNQLFAAPFDEKALRLTGPPQPIATDPHSWDVARTGTLAFRHNHSLGRLVTVDRQGREQLVLGTPPHTYHHPRYSPDGRYIAVQRDEQEEWDIWTFDTARRSWARVTFARGQWPEWTPDGQRVIYAVRDQSQPGSATELYSAAADGSGTPTRLLGRPLHFLWQGLLTPDNRRLVFWGFKNPTRMDIWLADLSDPTEARRLVGTAADEHSIALSPDGDWIAYRSDRTGTSEIYARRLADGEGGRPVPISVGGGEEPRWSRNGRELFYRSRDSLFVVPVELIQDRLRAGTPRALFPDPYARGFNAYYDVHPNGQEFVFIRARFDIRIELNALDELRGRR